MNYRHAYHAGNFADVLKHAVLVLVIEHMKLKPSPFRVVDTHAGVGLYDLKSEAALKTGEWQAGIGKLLSQPIPPAVAAIIAPYLDIVRQMNIGDGLAQYPGSPLIARRLLRPGDTLVVNELHPEDRESLRRHFAGDAQTKVLELDGWTALKSLLPPKERRGIVLVDPPFEELGEFDRLAEGLAAASKRFATGTFLFWYPIKDSRAIAAFHRRIKSLGLAKLLTAELYLRPPTDPVLLNGTGLLIHNPPFTLPGQLSDLMPFLAGCLAVGKGGSFRLEWLTGERLNSS